LAIALVDDGATAQEKTLGIPGATALPIPRIEALA
jgi:hypothetical protein